MSSGKNCHIQFEARTPHKPKCWSLLCHFWLQWLNLSGLLIFVLSIQNTSLHVQKIDLPFQLTYSYFNKPTKCFTIYRFQSLNKVVIRPQIGFNFAVLWTLVIPTCMIWMQTTWACYHLNSRLMLIGFSRIMSGNLPLWCSHLEV